MIEYHVDIFSSTFQIYSSLVGCHFMTQLELGKILKDGFFDSRSNLIPPIGGYQELFNRPQSWNFVASFSRMAHWDVPKPRLRNAWHLCFLSEGCPCNAVMRGPLGWSSPDLNFSNYHPKNRFRSCMNGVYVTPVTTTTPWMGLQHPSNEGGHFIRKHVLIVHLSLFQDISSFGYVKCHLLGEAPGFLWTGVNIF